MFLLKVTLQWSLFIPYTLVFTVEHSSPVDVFGCPCAPLLKSSQDGVMLLSPLVPRTLGGVTEFLPVTIRRPLGGETVRIWNNYLTMVFTIFYPKKYLMTKLDKRKQWKPLWSGLRRPSTWFFESLDILSHLLTAPAQSELPPVLKRALALVPSFSNSGLGCWWLWGGWAWAWWPPC